MSNILASLEALYQGQSLDKAQMTELFSAIMQGAMDPVQMAALLTALKIKGETPEEIAGAARALVENAAPFPTPEYDFADIVGTGGDGHHTINISSAAAIVAASCGQKVAKHGNRSVSSKSGSADLFNQFGVNLTMSAQTARNCLDKTNLCFLFAPNYHTGFKHAIPVRQALKTRTIFNVLGPLANPAHPSHMMIGVYTPALLQPFAETLKLLGYQNAIVVHGSGLDELALHGPSECIRISNGELIRETLTPETFGLQSAPLEAIKGGEPAENKAMIEAVLAGKGESAHRDAVAMNAGALLFICGKADSYKAGAQMALDAMQSGKPLATIKAMAATSQEQ